MTATPQRPSVRSRLISILSWLHTAPGAPRLPTGRQARWRRVLPVALVGAVFAAIVVADGIGLPGKVDPTAPFVVGYHFGIHEALAARGVPIADELSQYGYDGQWFLGQANDPLLFTDLALTFDYPRYRSIRVLLPALGWLLAAGQPAATPWALLVVQILAVALGCAACGRLVSAYGRSRWWGLVFAVIPGVWVGVAYGTAEPLGVALAMLGVSLMIDRRYGWAGLAFAGTGLTKETYIAFAVGAACYLAVDATLKGERWLRRAALLVVPGAVSLIGWWAYVEVSLPPDQNYGVFSRFAAPFVGWFELFGAMLAGDFKENYPFGWASEAVLITSFVVLVVALAVALWLRQSVLAYLAAGWGLFGLIIAGFLLERFLSTQRALAPAIAATVVFLIAVGWRRRKEPVDQPPELVAAGERAGAGR
ncbi:MAG TPA: hypothetical protein VIL37_00190 [Natronosporangium sp.]